MNGVASLLEELARLGVQVTAEQGQLRINAPRGVMTDELRQRVLASKDGIVERMQGRAAQPAGAPARLVPELHADHLAFPLSDLQLGFYVANDPYMEFHVRPHFYMEFEHRGFDVAAYEAAWNKALRRHRRELCRVDGDLQLQLLAGTPEVACQVYDWRDLAAEDAAARQLEVRGEMMRRELPLDAWPWLDLRVSLWREQGEERARVHYNHNNFFWDGFGTNQLLAEIEDYYRHPERSLAPLELSYRDAVLGLERLAQSAAGEAARRYWFERLPGLPSPPRLPQRAGVRRRSRSRLTGRVGALERDAWSAFKRRASALALTPSNAVITAYAYVIATWSNSDHFILSQMVTRRFAELHPDLSRLLGNFASLYPLEVKLTASLPFADNARDLQRQVLEDVAHLQFGGMRVLQELNRLQGSFGAAPSPFVVGSGLFIKHYRKAAFAVLETSQTILDHQFFELEDGSLHYVWDLLEDLFPAGVIDEMWDAFLRLLRRLAAGDEAWRQAGFALAGGRRRLGLAAGDPAVGPVPACRLESALRTQAAARGDAAVLASAQGRLRYRELEASSAVLAAELSARGVKPGDLVPVVMDRDQELPVAVMAVLRAGAAYVPIDPRLPPERLALLLEDVGAAVALTQPRHRRSIAWPAAVTPIVVARQDLSGRAAAPAGAGWPDGDPSDLAYVIYTSGSTGRPKGVMIDHRGAVNTILDVNERFGVGPADKVFGVSAFSFDLSVYDLFGTVAAGACLVYPDPDAALDPGHWLEVALREGITIWSSVPALMSLLVETAERRQVRLPALRLAMLSGDKIPLELPAAIARVAPHARVMSLGGATEASIWSIVYPVESVDPSWSTIPYGYPMKHQFWEVRDRHDRPCPAWVPGELCIGGAGLAQGYWNDAAKTSRSFRFDALAGERLYRTGDLGRHLPGGCIEWLGRLDLQVKVQGQRIELGEIEATLAAHPAVRQAVAAVQESPGSGRPRLVAFVVAAGSPPPDVRQLESFLAAKLPAAMVPAAWRVVERLPLTANGKVDRRALLAAPFAEAAAAERRRERVPAEGAVERRLQAIWERVLGRDDLGVTDDFFELGGQSFDAIRILAMVKEELGKAYTLSDMWRSRTIRELAKDVAGRRQEMQERRERRIVAIDLEHEGEPLFLVHPAGGSAMAYAALGRSIRRPLYGIQAAAGAADAVRRRDLVALAESYVAELREVHAPGPYSLGGWSSGGMIAFAMAAQLEADGETVTQVFILDGPTPCEHGELDDERLLRWFLADLALGLPVDRLQGVRLAGLAPAEQLRRAAALLGSGGAPHFELEQLAGSFEVFRDLIVAGSRYRPRTIAANLTVVRVEQDVVEEFAAHPLRRESDWGWRRFTSGLVRCVRAPGTHHSFLREPLVGRWCSLLNEPRPGIAVASAAAGAPPAFAD